MKRAPGDYDPTWLVELVRVQRPEEVDLLGELARCVRKVGVCECGCGNPYFVDPKSAEWDYVRCVEVTRADGAPIVIDVLRSGKVGSIEVVGRS